MATPRKTTSKTAQAAKAAGAKVPQDRQTASSDVDPENFAFEWRGLEIVVNAEDFDDVEFIEMLQNNLMAALRQLLGNEQYREVIAFLKETDPKGRGKARMSELQEFFQDLQEAIRPFVQS